MVKEGIEVHSLCSISFSYFQSRNSYDKWTLIMSKDSTKIEVSNGDQNDFLLSSPS